MKKLSLLAATAAVALWAGTASAAVSPPAGVVYVGSGNDPFPNSLIISSLGINTPALAKFDCSDTGGCAAGYDPEDGPTPGNYTGAFSISTTNNETGTWSFNPALVTGLGGNPVLYPNYVVTKADGGYFVYQVTNSFSGNWSSPISGVPFTAGGGSISCGPEGNTCELSHISFYDTANPVPLPAALPMFLAALAGLGLVARRKA